MDFISMKKLEEDLPAEIKFSELRLPAYVRLLATNPLWSDDDFGKFMRCLALDTDAFANEKVSGDLEAMRNLLKQRVETKKRVAKYRKRKYGLINDGKDEGQDINSECYSNVTVTKSSDKVSSGDVVSSSITEKTPSDFKVKHPPIIPPKKKVPVSLEKASSHRSKKASSGLASESVASDLFSLLAEPGDPTHGMSVAAESPKTASGCPVEREEGSGLPVTGQDIENAPRAIPAGANIVPRADDSRVDIAWIPEKFTIFWSKYPRKVGKSDALKSFTKIIKSCNDVDKFMATCIASVEWWKSQQSWTRDGGKFIPYPATWLNKGHWKDVEDNSSDSIPGQAQFLRGASAESDEELLKRMQGG